MERSRTQIPEKALKHLVKNLDAKSHNLVELVVTDANIRIYKESQEVAGVYWFDNKRHENWE